MKKIDLFFSDKCNLSCEFCNSFFDRQPVKYSKVRNIIKDLAKEWVDYITWSGGDPLKYRFINKLLRYSKSLWIYNHVDSNWLAILTNDIDLWYIDLLWLSLNEYTEKYIEKVLDKVNWKVKLKINTCLTNINKWKISKYHIIVKKYNIEKWSIYQFWSLWLDTRKSSHFAIDTKSYDSILDTIIDHRIERRYIKDRVWVYDYITTSWQRLINNGRKYIKNI